MQKTVTINDVDMDVEYTGTEYHPATWDDPAYGGEVDIEAVLLDGKDVTELLADWVVDRIRQKLEEELQDDLSEAKACADEDRAERIHEERMMREVA